MRIGRTAALLVGVVTGFVSASSLGQGIGVKAQANTLPPFFKQGAVVKCSVTSPADGRPLTITAISGSWIRADYPADPRHGKPGGSLWTNTDSGLSCTGPGDTVQ